MEYTGSIVTYLYKKDKVLRMSTLSACRQCGRSFEPKRSDHLFCSAKCVAAYYRANPNPEYIHAEKEQHHWHYCEECGVPFAVNDYAQRGGKRAPTYCSPKCKQKAYRQRGKDTQPQAERRYTTEGANRAEYDRQQAERRAENERIKQEYDRQRRQQQQQERQRQQAANDPYEGMSKYEKAYMILGVKEPLTKTKLRKAYYAAMKKVHPDVYKGDDATQKAQAINWAYEFLK
jgi:hypothetical protein